MTRLHFRTSDDHGEIAVFLIGARINKLWKVHQWWPVARAMPRMLAELTAQPELGLLGYEQWAGRTTLMVQYWRSMDHLMDYARATNREHLPAWRAFNQRPRTDAVGIWHEIYTVRPGAAHATYVNMPPFGLGRIANRLALTHAPLAEISPSAARTSLLHSMRHAGGAGR